MLAAFPSRRLAKLTHLVAEQVAGKLLQLAHAVRAEAREVALAA